MPVIGQFMRENDGFIGHLTTLSRPNRPMPRTRRTTASMCLTP